MSENENVKMVHYNDVSILFVKMKGTWLVATKNFGNALGYNNAGRRLVTSVAGWKRSGLLQPITNEDMLHNGDATIFEGQTLKDFLSTIPGTGIVPDSGTVNGNGGLSVLSLQGASKVLAKANMKGAKELRNRWEEVTTALMNNKPMPLFVSKPAQLEIKGTKKAKDTIVDIDPLAKVKKAIQLAKDLEELGAISLTVAKDIAHKAMNNAVSEMWPEAVVPYQDRRLDPQAMTVDSLAPALGLRAGQELPAKWKGFSTAAELGKVFGKSSESVGHHIPSILEEQYGEGVEMRANKIADRLGTALDPVKFRNSVDPETGLATVYSEGGHCIALYGQNAAGGFNWRNYWSPQLSNILIVKLAERYKMALPPQQPNGQKAMPAPIPFTAIQKIPDKA